MEINNISQVSHRFCNNDAMTALELDMMLESDDDKHIEYLLLSAQFRSGDDLSPREAMRLALLERQFGDQVESHVQPVRIDEAERSFEAEMLKDYQELNAERERTYLVHPHTTPITPTHTSYIDTYTHTETHTHTETRTEKPKRKTKTERATPEFQAPRYSSKSWKKMTHHERMQYAANILQNGLGEAFTLNFSKEQEENFLKSANPMRSLTLRLNAELRKAGLAKLPYMVAFEVSPDGRLHAHGAFLRRGDEKAVKLVFRKAGGLIKKRGTAARQLSFRSIYNADGWDRYLKKAKNKTKKAIGVDKVTFISQSLVQLCTSLQREFRR
jgi:hypothetical protein